MPRLSILHLHQKTSLSTGSVQQMLQAAGGLRARGHHVAVIAPRSAELTEIGNGMNIDVEVGAFRHLLDLPTLIRLRRVIRRHRPDVLHAHKGLAHAMALVALAGNPWPALIANRGVSFPLTRLNRGKYRSSRTDRVITVCEAIRDVIQTSGNVDPHKIEVVYAATDMDRFDRSRLDPASFRRKERIPAGAFVIMQSGTRDWKGWKDAVDAFAALRASVPDARLLIVGDDGASRESAVREYLAERSLADAVHVLGYRGDIEEVIAASDVTVDASWEGTGITGTIRESMALGTPVIATDCGGNRELIHDRTLGWLIERRNPDQLLAALREAAGDPARREAVGRAAEQFVRLNFSVDRRIERLESIYLSVLRSRSLDGDARATGDRRPGYPE